MPRSIILWAAPWAVGLVTLFAGTAGADFAPIAGWDHQLFPSYLVATATLHLQQPEGDDEAQDEILGDPQGVLGIEIESPGDETPVTVTISGDEILEPSTFSG